MRAGCSWTEGPSAGAVTTLSSQPRRSKSLKRIRPVSLTCGVLRDGRVTFWGLNNQQQSTPTGIPRERLKTTPVPTAHPRPPNPNAVTSPKIGEFASVSVAGDHSCAVRTDGSAVCWGNPETGQPPDGEFRSIDVSDRVSCGPRNDGSVVCCGRDAYEPPPEKFRSVSTYGSFSCGVRTTGEVTCFSRVQPISSWYPSGEFVSISLGRTPLWDTARWDASLLG